MPEEQAIQLLEICLRALRTYNHAEVQCNQDGTATIVINVGEVTDVPDGFLFMMEDEVNHIIRRMMNVKDDDPDLI
jgi:hypothetical protein